MTSIYLGESLATIGEGAFLFCYALESVTFPESMRTVGETAFGFCENLASVELNEGLTAISAKAFHYCYALESITIPDSVTAINDYTFNYERSLTTLEVDADVTSIGYQAFYGCPNLEYVRIGDNVTSIGSYAFGDCDGLLAVEVGDGVTVIEDQTFWSCSSLNYVDLGNGVTTIGERVFEYCKNLKVLYLGENLASVSSLAFGDNTPFNPISIEEVYFGGSRKQWLDLNFPAVFLSDDAQIYYHYRPSGTAIPAEGGNLYLDCETGEIYACDAAVTSARIPIQYQGVIISSIASGAFEECSELAEVEWDGPKWYWEMVPIGDDNAPLESAQWLRYEDPVLPGDAIYHAAEIPGKTLVSSCWGPLPVDVPVFCAAYDQYGKMLAIGNDEI